MRANGFAAAAAAAAADWASSVGCGAGSSCDSAAASLMEGGSGIETCSGVSSRSGMSGISMVAAGSRLVSSSFGSSESRGSCAVVLAASACAGTASSGSPRGRPCRSPAAASGSTGRTDRPAHRWPGAADRRCRPSAARRSSARLPRSGRDRRADGSRPRQRSLRIWSGFSDDMARFSSKVRPAIATPWLDVGAADVPSARPVSPSPGQRCKLISTQRISDPPSRSRITTRG